MSEQALLLSNADDAIPRGKCVADNHTVMVVASGEIRRLMKKQRRRLKKGSEVKAAWEYCGSCWTVLNYKRSCSGSSRTTTSNASRWLCKSTKSKNCRTPRDNRGQTHSYRDL